MNDQNGVDLSLTDSEKRLVQAMGTGSFANFQVQDEKVDNPSNGANWKDDRTLRAEVIVKLCIDPENGSKRHAKGIRVKGARITGDLDFEATTLLVPLHLTDCFFENPINLQDSQTRTLVFDGSMVPGIRADRMITKGSVSLGNRFVASGEVSFFLANIEGVLDCSSGAFSNTDGIAFNGIGLKATALNMRYGFKALGAVRILNASIGNHFDCAGATFEAKEIALNAEGLVTGGSVLLRSRISAKEELIERFTAKGTVRLYGAQIGANLECQGATFENPNGLTLDAERIVTRGYVLLRSYVNNMGEPIERFSSRGTVRLFRANIGADLDCQGAMFEAKDTALHAEGVVTGGSVLLRSRFGASGELLQRFTAKGAIRLYAAKIGGNLDCQGAIIENPTGNTIEADSIVIGRAALLRAHFDSTGNPTVRFMSKGTIRFLRADIGGDLDFQGAVLENPKGVALQGYGISAKGSVLLRRFFAANGEVQLSRSRISDDLDCEGASFENSDGRALSATGIVAGGSVVLRSRFNKTGALLEQFNAKGAVRFYGAKIEGNFECQAAAFENADGNSLDAEGVVVGGAALFRARPDNKGEPDQRFISKGTLRLARAEIGGDIDFQGASLDNPRGIAVQGYGLAVKGNVLFRNGFSANGEVRFADAEIGNNFDCNGAKFDAKDIALDLGGVIVGGSVLLRSSFNTSRRILEQFFAKGAVRLYGARVSGDLDCQSAAFEYPEGNALDAGSIVIGGAALLRARLDSNGQSVEPFLVKGSVRLFRAEIGGDLDFTGALLLNPTKVVLNGFGLAVKGSVLLRHGFRASGEVRLISAEIGNYLDCEGGTFENADGIAVNGERTATGGSVLLRARLDYRENPLELGRFVSNGTVRLFRAEIGGDLDCTGAKLEKPGGVALDAYGLVGKGDVLFKKGFKATGLVSFDGATIGAAFECSGAQDAEIDRLSESLRLIVPDNAPPKKLSYGLSLNHAIVGRLVDEVASWPSAGQLHIDGFVYNSIGGDAPTSTRARLDWLNRLPKGEFRPQPYEHLARVLRQMGRESEAREILIAKQDARCKSGHYGKPSRIWNWFLKVTISHGYKPWKASVPMIFFVCFGWLVFYVAEMNGAMKPTKTEPSLSQSVVNCSQLDSCRNPLQPFVYSLDAFLPIIDLNQDKNWTPDASEVCLKYSLPVAGKPCVAIYRWYLWFHIFAGYILTTLVVAALTGLVKKD